jgi:serpin B
MRRARSLFVLVASLALLAPLAAACASARETTTTRLAQSARTGDDAPGHATAELGLDLLRRLGGGGNVVFSPDSIAVALAMAGTGAAGETASQMAHTLHLASPAEFGSIGRLQQTIASAQGTDAEEQSEAPKLSIANGLFVQRGYALEPSFTNGLQQAFGAEAQPVDFAAPSAVEAINDWVAQQTKGLIGHLVSELPVETRLALANAIYLKAAWRERFKRGATRSASFHGERATSSTAFMHETETLPYGHGRDYLALSLPYADSTLSLLVVLPVGEPLRAFERKLSATTLDRIVRRLADRYVRVSLPRFHLRTQTTLNAPLVALGMRDAFSESKASFSGMTKAERLMIGEVIHGADFNVDEQGTEAAAATVVTMEPESAESHPRPLSFDADRPFLFFLRDQRTGALLFAGRLVKPQD